MSECFSNISRHSLSYAKENVELKKKIIENNK